ncbi:hypothetical protein [Streptomyces sp. T028]|uniref:hypothetical protein n=1 Tax=Streptomyces sp. T028 TaxID=3394379 RepID=UPI003A856080
MHGPIQTRDPASCADAYAGILGWPVAVGHRYRPRGGCTCGALQDCPTPGAHPRPGTVPLTSAAQLTAELAVSPGASLIAPTLPFDVIVLPKSYGMAAMASLDRVAPVPCLLDGERAALFVLPSTARYLFGPEPHPALDVRSGPNGWVALPPSHSVRWDTPPWNEQTHQPLPLMHGQDLSLHLAAALRAAGMATAQPT